MEDILNLYCQPYDPQYPVLCMDELSRQLIRERILPLAVKPGHPLRYDYQYIREGVCNLFLFVEQLRGWRYVTVESRRTKKEWVKTLQYIIETFYADAKKIRLVVDNLNTHNPAALYEILPTEQARALLDKLEFHYTPKHASWLNIAECEISVLSRQCLNKRIPTQSQMRATVTSWFEHRNAKTKEIHWQFTTADARIRLQSLYPSINE